MWQGLPFRSAPFVFIFFFLVLLFFLFLSFVSAFPSASSSSPSLSSCTFSPHFPGQLIDCFSRLPHRSVQTTLLRLLAGRSAGGAVSGQLLVRVHHSHHTASLPSARPSAESLSRSPACSAPTGDRVGVGVGGGVAQQKSASHLTAAGANTFLLVTGRWIRKNLGFVAQV